MDHNMESVKKFFNAPGLCTLDQIKDAKSFLQEYVKFRNAYREMVGHDPIGLTLESNLDKIEWYENYHKK